MKPRKDELKESLLKGVEAACRDLMADVEVGSSEKLAKLLEFYACKAHRWSANNLMTVLAQKPLIGKPVTIKEARALSHTPNPDAQPAHIFVPVFVPVSAKESAGVKAKLLAVGMDRNSAAFVENFIEWCGQNALEPTDKSAARMFVETDPRSKTISDDKIGELAEKLAAAVVRLKEMEAKEQEMEAKGQQAPENRPIMFFKTVPCVYDLGVETTGPEITSVSSNAGDPGKVFGAMKEWAQERGWNVGNVVLSTGQAGTAGADGSIQIGAWMDDASKATTLAHEMAHQILHISDGKLTKDISRETREIQAESIAYAVCRHFGIESHLSGEYIRNFGGTPKEVMANLGTICKTSRQIIEGVSQKLDIEQDMQEEMAPPSAEDEMAARYYLKEDGGKQQKFDAYETLLAAISESKADLEDLQLEVYAAGIGGSYYHDRTVSAKEFVEELFAEFVDHARESGLSGVAYHDRGMFALAEDLDEVPEHLKDQAVDLCGRRIAV
jgi:hypothetical protein